MQVKAIISNRFCDVLSNEFEKYTGGASNKISSGIPEIYEETLNTGDPLTKGPRTIDEVVKQKCFKEYFSFLFYNSKIHDSFIYFLGRYFFC